MLNLKTYQIHVHLVLKDTAHARQDIEGVLYTFKMLVLPLLLNSAHALYIVKVPI